MVGWNEGGDAGSGSGLPLSGGALTGPLALGGNKITGLGAGTANGDVLRYEQLVGLYLLLAGGSLTGNLVFNPTTKGVKGTTTNDNAEAGNVGEYVESVVSNVDFPATTTTGDAASISLSAGAALETDIDATVSVT